MIYPFSFEQEGWWFYTFSHAGQGAVLIKEALIFLAWLIQAWRITSGSHSCCGHHRSEASSTFKDTKSEGWDAGRFLLLLLPPITSKLKQLFSCIWSWCYWSSLLSLSCWHTRKSNSAVLEMFQPWCAGAWCWWTTTPLWLSPPGFVQPRSLATTLVLSNSYYNIGLTSLQMANWMVYRIPYRVVQIL